MTGLLGICCCCPWPWRNKPYSSTREISLLPKRVPVTEQSVNGVPVTEQLDPLPAYCLRPVVIGVSEETSSGYSP